MASKPPATCRLARSKQREAKAEERLRSFVTKKSCASMPARSATAGWQLEELTSAIGPEM